MNVRTILTCSALALTATSALAQKAQVSSPVTNSSVTLFGIIDVAVSYGTGSVGNITQLTSGRSSPSRWGVRGFEDLGGGLTAGFWLESQINVDTGGFGTTNVNNQPNGSASALFSRRSTVSLIGSWGEVRLGRDFTASFRNRDDVDPFGTSGVGANLVDAVNIEGPAATRASNMVGYFLPANLWGFFGEAQYFMGETVDISSQPYSRAGDGYAARLGWAGGNFAVAVAGSRTNQARTATLGDVDAYNFGVSYDFQVVKLSGGYYYGKSEQFVPLTGTGWLVGAVVPIGATQLKMSYSSYGTDDLNDPRGDKLAVGAVYSLSKRTSLYGTYAYLRNTGGASYSLNNAITEPDRHSSGFDLGIKHTF